MLKSKILQPQDYDRFIAFNSQNSGADVKRLYVEQASIRIFFRSANPDEWVASYAINKKPDFRYLSVLMPEQKVELLNQHNLRETELVEITLLCRNRQTRWTTLEREQYYAMSLIDALRTGQRVVLGGTVETKLLANQMAVLNHLLYEGPMNLFGKPATGWLYYSTQFEVVWNGLIRTLKVLLGGFGQSGTSGQASGPIKPEILPNN